MYIELNSEMETEIKQQDFLTRKTIHRYKINNCSISFNLTTMHFYRALLTTYKCKALYRCLLFETSVNIDK